MSRYISMTRGEGNKTNPLSVKNIAGVRLTDVPYHLDRIFEYYIPDAVRDDICTGCFVTVPFGGGNRRVQGVVVSLSDESTFEYDNLKPIIELQSRTVKLGDELLKLCNFVSDHTFCTFGDALRAMIPPSFFARMSENFVLVARKGDSETKLPSDERLRHVLNYISVIGGKVTAERTSHDLGGDAAEALETLVDRGYIKRENSFTDRDGGKYREIISLAISEQEARDLTEKLRGKKQQALLGLLLSQGTVDFDCLRAEGIGREQIRALCDKNIIKTEKINSYRDPYLDREIPPAAPNILSDTQRAAADILLGLFRTGEPKAALLHGITGSGKTRVIKEMLDEVTAAGRSAIVLVPEIGLTPQTVAFFRSYYGDRIAVIHSMLSEGERFDAWRRIERGEVDLCIGTRSAVFAPFKNLGMIVIDEEQEHTYKSDMAPKYHTKDIARFRCAYHNALMLLSSATPSFESYYKAKSGAYTYVPLGERYGGAKLPESVISDLRDDAAQGNMSPIGSALRERLEETLKRGEQAILFINRRGYNNFLCCPVCGTVIMCPHCSVSMTYHAYDVREGSSHGCLMCHYCGRREPVPSKCPGCSGTTLRHVGCGTQKAEEEILKIFPKARIMRMDADTTQNKFSYEDILERFRAGDADILLGTQMVAKGHDFPRVTLVGVLSADSALYVDDFRANEKTFSLITQVTGRAGRADRPGCALIQTYNPEHPVLKLAAAQNYGKFYESEIALRRSLAFPPFCDIILLTLSSQSEVELSNVAVSINGKMKEWLADGFEDVKIQCFGPIPAPVYKVNEVYRLRFIIKCRMNSRTRMFVSTLLAEFSAKIAKRVNISADVNPNCL